jgi:Spy/CpxP family protein refolding chaperone
VRKALIAGIVVTVLLSAVALVVAYAGDQPAAPASPGAGLRCGGGLPVQLTESQAGQVTELRQQLAAKLEPLNESWVQARQEYVDLLRQANPSSDKVAAVQDKLSKLRADRWAAMQEFRTAVSHLLTPEQKAAGPVCGTGPGMRTGMGRGMGMGQGPGRRMGAGGCPASGSCPGPGQGCGPGGQCSGPRADCPAR